MQNNKWKQNQIDIWKNEKWRSESNSSTHPDFWLSELELDSLQSNVVGSCLNVGCGAGYETNLLRENGIQAYGIDMSPEMVDAAKKNYGDHFENLDLFKIENINSEFDTITTRRTLINIQEEKQELAISKLAEYCGDRLVLVEGTKQGYELLNKLRKKVGLPRIDVVDYNHPIDLDNCQRILADLDFEIVTDYYNHYYFLTRIYYAELMDMTEENVQYNTKFHKLAYKLQKNLASDFDRNCSPHVVIKAVKKH